VEWPEQQQIRLLRRAIFLPKEEVMKHMERPGAATNAGPVTMTAHVHITEQEGCRHDNS